MKNTINAQVAHVELLPMMKSMTFITMNFVLWWLSLFLGNGSSVLDMRTGYAPNVI